MARQIGPVVRNFQKWLIVVLLTIAVGGHWAIFQSAAWMGMLIKYADGASLSEALSKTFDGRHPCQLCRLVDEGKKAERKEPLKMLDTKIDFFMELGGAWFFAPQVDVVGLPPVSSAPQVSFSPLVPPPRAA